MGWLASDTAELSYADVRVPATNLVGRENSGFVQLAANFVSERIGLAVQSYACAQRSLDITVDWCRLRETFGFVGTPIEVSVRPREKRKR